ncbi:uncharacterized protein [Malus domestica]|uniref:uncharacterized protein n=1 Tax=Malus domestica TaxID=3750 RepID=UPI003974C10D
MNAFIDFLNNGNLISLSASGVPFTRTNGHGDNTRIYERLDRCVANSPWLCDFHEYSLLNYLIFGSDHSPIFLSNNIILDKRTVSAFKFEAMWIRHPEFKSFVKKSWTCDSGHRPQDRFVACVGTFKFLVRNWNKEIFGNIKERKDKLLSALNDIQTRIMSGDATIDSNEHLQEENNIKSNLSSLLLDEEVMWT